MQRRLFYLLWLLLLSGCTWFNKEEPVPSYITIHPFQVTTTSSQGTASHNITDGWLVINDQTLGCFELPATVPVLLWGAQEIKIIPGIKNNGLSGERKVYPFMQIYDTTITLEQGQIQEVYPATTYISNMLMWLEDFEDAGIQFTQHSTSEAGITHVSAPLQFEGARALLVDMPSGINFGRIHGTANLILPKFANRIYVELNYRCNNPFRVGVLHRSGGGNDFSYEITVSPTGTDINDMVWRKIYIDVTQNVNDKQNTLTHDLYFDIIKSENVTHAQLFVDNIKIIRYSN